MSRTKGRPRRELRHLQPSRKTQQPHPNPQEAPRPHQGLLHRRLLQPTLLLTKPEADRPATRLHLPRPDVPLCRHHRLHRPPPLLPLDRRLRHRHRPIQPPRVRKDHQTNTRPAAPNRGARSYLSSPTQAAVSALTPSSFGSERSITPNRGANALTATTAAPRATRSPISYASSPLFSRATTSA